MGNLDEAEGKLAARVFHALAQPGDGEGLAGRAAAEQIERAEGAGAVDKVRRGDVAEVRMAEARGEDGGREFLDLRAPEPLRLGQRQLGPADAREHGCGSHTASRFI